MMGLLAKLFYRAPPCPRLAMFHRQWVQSTTPIQGFAAHDAVVDLLSLGHKFKSCKKCDQMPPEDLSGKILYDKLDRSDKKIHTIPTVYLKREYWVWLVNETDEDQESAVMLQGLLGDPRTIQSEIAKKVRDPTYVIPQDQVEHDAELLDMEFEIVKEKYPDDWSKVGLLIIVLEHTFNDYYQDLIKEESGSGPTSSGAGAFLI